MKAVFFKLKRTMGAISMVRNFKNHSNGPGLEFQEVRGDPKHLTQILETGNSISVVGQNPIES